VLGDHPVEVRGELGGQGCRAACVEISARAHVLEALASRPCVRFTTNMTPWKRLALRAMKRQWTVTLSPTCNSDRYQR